MALGFFLFLAFLAELMIVHARHQNGPTEIASFSEYQNPPPDQILIRMVRLSVSFDFSPQSVPSSLLFSIQYWPQSSHCLSNGT